MDGEIRLVSCGGIWIDSINCDPFSFLTEGVELNRHWGKNSGFKENIQTQCFLYLSPCEFTGLYFLKTSFCLIMKRSICVLRPIWLAYGGIS